ncbi:MAG TPA: sigma-70 family RNA polymerase sigma factor, partial [Candidatus Ozemobacteraceae bacterium]|nr:sigma-70 family RNA polymerase sigma factor [Candidatus Ozemobacteraceae bacterium]
MNPGELLAPETEARLIKEVQAGRAESFSGLVESHWPRVRAVVRRMVRDEGAVEDLCQEAFLRAYSKIEQFDVSRRFSPWLMKIAVNLVSEHFR